MNLSFTSELHIELADSFAFFSDLCSKYLSIQNVGEMRLLDLNEYENNQTVVILPPVFAEQENDHADPSTSTDSSAFVYDSKSGKFPSTKATNPLDDSNRRSKQTPSSASSSFSHVPMIPNTPIGIRTKAEKLQSQKKIDMVLVKQQQQHHHNHHHHKNNHQSHQNQQQHHHQHQAKSSTDSPKTNCHFNAKFQAFYLLSQAYSLWFIHLPEYLKGCETREAKKTCLNYAFYVLIQMNAHHLTQPDEICFRIVMQLCLLYKLPTVAVKTMLHMRKFKLELTPITYSFYNKALVDLDSWPTFQQDRWAKIRVMTQVIAQFKLNLKLKATRERLKAKKQRRNSNKMNKRKSSVAVVSLSSSLASASAHNKSNKSSEQVANGKSKDIDASKSEIISNKFSLDDEISDKRILTLKQNENSLLINQIGILMLNTNRIKRSESMPVTNNQHRHHSIHEIDLINKSKINIAHLLRSTTKTPQAPTPTTSSSKSLVNSRSTLFSTPITKNDPLGAFAPSNAEIKPAAAVVVVKKKLFGEPFASDAFNPSTMKIFNKKENESESDQESDYYDSDDDEDTDDDDDEDDDDFAYEDSENEDFHRYNDNDTHGERTNSINSQKPQSVESIDAHVKTPVKTWSKESNFITITPLLSSTKVASFMNNSSSKIRGVGRFLNEKFANQQPQIESLTSRLKSFSGYHLSTPQFLSSINDFVKSSSNSSNLNENAENSHSASSETNTVETAESHHHHHHHLDLDPIVSLDDKFKPLKLEWWNMETNRTRTNPGFDDTGLDSNRPLKENCLRIRVAMTSCNVCEKCRKFLYDEEIMSGWSLNESDLNVKCTNCSALLVPKLYIKIEDHESIRGYFKRLSGKPDTTLDPLTSVDEPHTEAHADEFNVHYLSPLVVRKELENIIINKSEKENDLIAQFSIIDTSFINDHSVVFWNLLWYFQRIGVDSGQLTNSLIDNRISRYQSNNPNPNPDADPDPNTPKSAQFMKLDDLVQQNLTSTWSKTNKTHSHPNLRISCMWDNLRLHEKFDSHEVPLYLSYLRLQQRQHKMVNSILSANEVDSTRKSSVSLKILERTLDHIVRQIKENSEILSPFKTLLKDRLLLRINYLSIYREILFLVLVALERELIDVDALDSEYRSSYRTLLKTSSAADLLASSYESILASDKPPNNLAVWCRRLFSPLHL
jgi:hypothetical protein